MAMQVALVLLALAGSAVLADPFLAFPEDVRNGARIVSGWEAEEGQFPFQLSLRMVSNQGVVTACGGSIVHPEWAITAAHCSATRESIVIRAGTVNLTRPYYIFETTEFYNHPFYNQDLPSVVQPNDICIINFGRALVFNDRVQPIRIQRSADMNRDYNGIRLTASGWGLTWTTGSSPENMNWVFLSGTSNAACRQAYSGSSIIQASTICARGYNDTTQSICQGDSGGPLTVVDEDGKVSLVGVASFVSGTGCHTDIPAGFCRPGYYHNWFLEVTGINFDWDYEVEPETTPEPQPETESTPEPETTPDTQPETETTPESQPETESTPESQPETESTPEPETTPESQPETESTPEPETTPESQPETESTPEPETESEESGESESQDSEDSSDSSSSESNETEEESESLKMLKY